MDVARALVRATLIGSAIASVACIEPRKHYEPGQIPSAAPGTVALGQPCQGFEACAPVSGKEVACRCSNTNSVPVCVTDAEEGQPCSGPGVYVPCRAGTVCAGFSDAGTTITCVALGKVGDRCDFGGCLDDLYCDSTGHCGVPTAELGQPCTGTDAWSCTAPNVCDLQSNSCVAPTPTGGKCSSIIGGRSSCGRSAYCTLSTGEVNGTCQPALADGELCWVPEQCLSGICGQGACGRGYKTGSLVSCSL